MKNSKRTKILLVSVVGLLVLSFIPSILAHPTQTRSLDDWFYSIDGGYLNPSVGHGMFHPDPPGFYPGYMNNDELIAFIQINEFLQLIPIWDCEYHGMLHDKELSDGTHEITVILHVKDAPVMVETFNPENPLTLFIGEIDYLFKMTFTINPPVWTDVLVNWMGIDDDGYDDFGRIILPVGYIPLDYSGMFGVELDSMLFIAKGEGVLANSWEGMDAGEEAKVMMGMMAKNKDGIIEWPMDFIKIF